MVEEGRKRSVRVRGSGKLFHFPWEGGSGRGRDTDIGFETLKPRDRKRQIHGRLFPLVTWALLTTHYPMTQTKPKSKPKLPSLFLFFSFLFSLQFHLTYCYISKLRNAKSCIKSQTVPHIETQHYCF